MHTISKHIRRAAARQLVAVMAQILQVAGQSRTVAADVNDTLRSHLYHGRKDALLAALARRVYDDDICRNAFLFIFFREDFLCLSDKKFCVCHTVQCGIGFCILNRCRNNLDAIYLLRALSQKKGDRADTTVQIPYRLLSGQSRIFQRLIVELLRLKRIDLIKRER